MKSQILNRIGTALLVLTLSLAALPAKAGNEGPHGMPPDSSKVIAELKMSLGLPIPGQPRTQGVVVRSNGHAYAFTDQKFELVAIMSAQVLVRFKAAISKVQAGKLIDLQEGEPACFDAPTSIYRVYGTEEIVIGQRMRCHRFILENSSDGNIQSVLDGLLQLSWVR